MSDPRNDGTDDAARAAASTPPNPPAPPSAPPAAPSDSGYTRPTAPYQAPPSAQPGGYSQNPSAQPGGYAKDPYATGASAAPKTLSLIGMIAGIVGILGSGVALIPIIGSIFALFIPAAAVVLGFMGKSKEGAPARAFWLTALITGFIGIAIAVVALILWIGLFTLTGTAGSTGYNF